MPAAPGRGACPLDGALHGIAGACVVCAKMGNQPALLLLSIYAGGQLCLFGSSEVKQSSLFFRWLLWQG